MSESANPLVKFLLEETGETLYVVVQHETNSWDVLYVRDAVRERIKAWERDLGELMDHFREDAKANRQREELFDVGSFHCSLHLFDELLIIHFSQSSGEGILFGYSPQAAPNLTTFVDLCLPYIRRQLEEYTSNGR